jgi:PTH1 family peptidyl-tRNA hydrolase
MACWRMDCGKDMLCDACPALRPRGDPRPAPAPASGPPAQAPGRPDAGGGLPGPHRVLVGIGNPGEKYRNTPHNVGFAVLDILAERQGAKWEAHGDAQIAWTDLAGGEKILLVKPQKHVNNTGRVLLSLAQSMGFAGDDCVLVHDDIHLPVGKVRTRLRGSDGGHLGVRSVLTAFQTGDIARVKVGVASATSSLPPAQYLVSSFPHDVAERVNAACSAAADRLMTEVTKAERAATTLHSGDQYAETG